jgi:TM2 domain-containing membrane protein YozV
MAYFVRIKGKIFGPFDEPQLLDMKSKGKITHRTEVSENNQRDWQSADTFPFLFEPVQKAMPEPPQPSAVITDGWFYSTNGKEGHGPVAAIEIEQMLQSGLLDGKSYVWQQGKTAGFIKNEPLFASFVSGSAKPSPESAPSSSPTPANNTKYSSNQAYEITGTNTQADTSQAYHSDTSPDSRPTATQSLSRHTFIFLAVLVGMLGIHDFYAKRNGYGIAHVACLGPWIFMLLFMAISSVLGSLGVHIRVDWFDSIGAPTSIGSLERAGSFVIFCFIILPFVSWVMALIEIVCVTADGLGREMERF